MFSKIYSLFYPLFPTWSPKWMSYKISESLTVSFGITPNKMSLCRADVAPIKSISVCKHEYINILAALLQVIEWWPPSPAPASKSYPSQPRLPLKCQTAELHVSKSGSREMECPPSSAFLPVSLLFRLGRVGPTHIQGIFPPLLTLKSSQRGVS